jgi:2-polyprenyl-3-methyl-5-hydroxy-6-metoxy-1,4-benzoquinol methylase
MTDLRSSSRDETSREWFEDWFNNPLYLQVYSHRDASEAALCVETILRVTGFDQSPSRGLSVLDIACGAGRHAFAFARKGLQVTANDLSRMLLDTAREQACSEGLCVEFSECDMRTLRLARKYDLVVQLFSSFGYFETDDEDRLVISNVSDMLIPGGWYVLDLINPGWLRNHFVPRSEKRSGSLSITEERKLSDRSVVKRITVQENESETRSFTESVRLFRLGEATLLLEEGGFTIERVAGDYDGRKFDAETSPRMLLFARKKG